jgi:hypothetical protein
MLYAKLSVGSTGAKFSCFITLCKTFSRLYYRGTRLQRVQMILLLSNSSSFLKMSLNVC